MGQACLIVISAPSGAGKTTLCKRLLQEFSSQLKLSISVTTRAPRGTEKNGVEYTFVTKEQFQEAIQKNEFAEWALVHTNFYGTTKESIRSSLGQGLSLLLDIDVQGAASVRKAFEKQSLLVFIAPPNLKELENRLRSRKTDSPEVIKVRLENAKHEMEQAKHFDHVIVNDDLERAYQELKNIVQSRMA